MKKLNLYLAGLSGLVILLPCHFAAQPFVALNTNEAMTVAAPAKTTSTPPTTEPAFISQVNVIYRVQILALKRPITIESIRVNGMNDKVYAIQSPTVTRYCMGEFHDLKAATDYKEQIVKNGFEDACVVAYRNGDRITIRQSLALLEDK